MDTAVGLPESAKIQPLEAEKPEKIMIRRINQPQSRLAYRCAKRTLDLVASLIGSVLLIPPMAVIAVAIKADSKGPVLYKQERLGTNGKPFTLYKFRSMRVDAEANGAQWATDHDERCTAVGAVLRLYRLDELPQIPFNILPGTLSLVGPRPERKVFYDKFATYIDGFEQRLYVKPGLTGLAQVSGGYDLLPEEKIIYDLEYIENLSMKTDIVILFKTIAAILNQKGAR
ncbi:MAG: sugar transferase [Clostridiales bacterium]|nr:sugar transferase [Clostridiales bacterium]